MASGSGKADKALKDKQNKLTLMEKVLMRDKHDKASKKEREHKATSKDLEKDDGEAASEGMATVGKSKGKSKEKTKRRDKSDKQSRKDRDSKSLSKEVEVDKESKDAEESNDTGSKWSLMDKVFMRDKSDKQSKKDRDSKSLSKEVEGVDKDSKDAEEGESGAKWSLIDKVFMRDRHDRVSKREREFRAHSKDLETPQVVINEAEDADDDAAAKEGEDATKHKFSLMDKVMMRHEKMSRKERELKGPSRDLDKFKSTSLGDLSLAETGVSLREHVDKSPRKEKNRRSANVVK